MCVCYVLDLKQSMTEHNSEKNVHDDRDGPERHNAPDEPAYKEGSIGPSADCFRRNRLLLLFPFLLLFDCFRRNGLLLLFFYYHLNPLLTAFVVTASILIILANGLLCVFLRKDRRLWFQVSSKTIIQK